MKKILYNEYINLTDETHMKLQSLSLLCLILTLSGCKETATTPTLPPMSYTTVARPQAVIQNTEAFDQSIRDAEVGN